MLSCQGKCYCVIPVIIYYALPEGPEFGTSYGYVTTYQDLGTAEEMTKGLWDVGTCKRSYRRQRVVARWGMTEEILGANPWGNSFHDFLSPGNISLDWIRTQFT